MEYTETERPMQYDWWADGPQGAKFELRPVRGVHTQEDIYEAKHWLRDNHDVVRLTIDWQDHEN